MQCLTQLTPPTAVTHCVSLPFLSSSANNLIVAKTSLLQIFSFKSVAEDAPEAVSRSPVEQDDPQNKVPPRTPRRERIQTTKLVLIAQHELAGTVTALSRVKVMRSRSGGEALLVALKDAKLSLVEWDPERYGVSTISIHYYEREDLQGVPWNPTFNQCVNYLTVDPGSRCAALKFGARHIAILPFHQAGDDLVMEDYDPDVGMSPPKSGDLTHKTVNGDLHLQTPYAASFVLSLLALDPILIHPIHLAFLYGYREPTFGILSSQIAPSSALLLERKDPISYTVYTLDLDQRASTTLLSISNLPFDLHAVLPVPLPIGGALLIGQNELIHVDQSGKTNAIAVNEFASTSTRFALPSEANLGLRLEDCMIEQLGPPNGDLLIILRTGELAVLKFKIDGRSISGLSVKLVHQQHQAQVLSAPASCTAGIGRGRVFIGCENSDSVILGWSSRSTKIKRQRSTANMDTEDELDVSDLDEGDLEDEDDLYSNEKPSWQTITQPVSPAEDEGEEYVFRIHDCLRNIAPLGNVAFIEPDDASEDGNGDSSQINLKNQLVVTSGWGKACTLSKMSPTTSPQVQRRHLLGNVRGVWSVASKTPPKDRHQDITNENGLAEHHDIIITSMVDNFGEEQSRAYSVEDGVMEELAAGDFDSDAGATIAIGTLNSGTRIVQVLKAEIRAYEDDLSLAQIFPMSDDPTPEDPKVIASSFAEPYVLLFKDDLSLMVLKADHAGELEEVERSDALSSAQWVSGSLFDDSNDVFRLESDEEDVDEDGGSILMVLLTADGGLQIFKLSNLNKPVYTANGLSFLPPFLSEDFTVRRSTARERLIELLVAEIGDSISKSLCLILRSAADDLIIYQPYQSSIERNTQSSLRFLKTLAVHAPRSTLDGKLDEERKWYQALQIASELDGHTTVFMSGSSPCVILKTAATYPQVIPLDIGPTRRFSGIHTTDQAGKFLYVDDKGGLNMAQLPVGNYYISGWCLQKLFEGEGIKAFDFHQDTARYVIVTSNKASFMLPEDELHPEWSGQDSSFPPQVDQDLIKLLDPATQSITDAYELELAEIVTCLKTMSLETSEHSHVRQNLIVIGTSIISGEDLPMKGRVYIFDIIEVVPEPDHPETHLKLKLVAKEEVKGAVTAVTEIGSEGFLLVAQGQKCMVRGLKEDGTLLPVAFIDTQCYVSVTKELKGTGLCILADVVKGVWFAGYTEDPYQLRLFGKGAQHIEVVTAEFLPDGEQLYIVAIDAEGVMHALQFEPHNPKSLTGQRLLALSSFNTGAYPSTMMLLQPQNTTVDQPLNVDVMDTDTQIPTRSILITSATGSISLLTSLSSSEYRSLAALQTYLANTLPHPLGLNGRAYRAAEADNTVRGRAILDGNVLKRLGELGSWKRGEALARAGLEEWEVRGLMGKIIGRGSGLFRVSSAFTEAC